MWSLTVFIINPLHNESELFNFYYIVATLIYFSFILIPNRQYHEECLFSKNSQNDTSNHQESVFNLPSAALNQGIFIYHWWLLKAREINLLATFHWLIRPISTVIIVVAHKSLGDACFIVAAKRAVITCVVGC